MDRSTVSFTNLMKGILFYDDGEKEECSGNMLLKTEQLVWRRSNFSVKHRAILQASCTLHDLIQRRK